MRAETQNNVDAITKSLALLAQRMDWDTAAHRLEEFDAMIEAPDLWNDPAKAQKLMRERTELGRSKPNGFWQDYKFTNPTSKKIEPKQMYCERLDETIVCGGIYK